AAPFQDLPVIGGATTVRGYYNGRFAGDAALYNRTELYVPVFRVALVAPSTVGLMGLNDGGRVFASGSAYRSSAWHDGIGGGLWTSFLDNQYLITLTAVHGSERMFVYFG